MIPIWIPALGLAGCAFCAGACGHANRTGAAFSWIGLALINFADLVIR